MAALTSRESGDRDQLTPEFPIKHESKTSVLTQDSQFRLRTTLPLARSTCKVFSSQPLSISHLPRNPINTSSSPSVQALSSLPSCLSLFKPLVLDVTNSTYWCCNRAKKPAAAWPLVPGVVRRREKNLNARNYPTQSVHLADDTEHTTSEAYMGDIQEALTSTPGNNKQI
ncbi:unnamed protein product [Pleuronectes platessa]|uniref:Uncharacterized protein n=1 Tax=Pleuronectes platessa TaxID=8262 RepID=A0A9N7YNY1_PLEPL|nr:unnamed protein product [Pleuronectes platessa]